MVSEAISTDYVHYVTPAESDGLSLTVCGLWYYRDPDVKTTDYEKNVTCTVCKEEIIRARRMQIIDRSPYTPVTLPNVIRAHNLMMIVPFYINRDWAGEIAILNDSHAYHAAHRTENLLVEHCNTLQDLIIEIQERYGTIDLSANLRKLA